MRDGLNEMSSSELLLPAGSRLVHIGAPKTGTTSLQHSFHAARRSLSRYGVHYAGATAHPRLAARAVARGGAIVGERPPSQRHWDNLVDEVRRAGDRRVVVSSEIFSNADPSGVRRVVTEIGGGPVHVVITLRSVAKIAPSQWQQNVQDGALRVPYLAWLERRFRRSPYEEPRSLFWHRNLHGELTRRWAEVVGAQNVTVVVADESDPAALPRTFEALVGLPDGLLVPPDSRSNRSLSRGEAELVRLLNKRFHDNGWSAPWSEELHTRVVRRGVVRQMKTGRRPRPDEPRMAMPDWALQRSVEVGAEAVQTIKSLGVRVIGDLAALTAVPAYKADDRNALVEPALIPADALALAMLGAMSAGGRPRRGTKVAAVLAALSAINGAGTSHGWAGVPLVPVGSAARAVLAAIEGVRARTEFTSLPSVPADALGLAVRAAADTSGGGLATSTAGVSGALERQLLEALGVRTGGLSSRAHRLARWAHLPKRW